MKRIAIELAFAVGCHKAPQPTWSTAVELPGPYPIRLAACSASGRHVLIDREPGLVSIDPSAHQVTVGAPPAPWLERSGGTLVLQGPNVLDVDTGATAAAPLLSSLKQNRWSESRDGKTFAYAQGLMPTTDGRPTKIDVFGARAWSTQVPDLVDGMRLSNDGRVLAVIQRKEGTSNARLELLDEHGTLLGEPIDLGITTSSVVLFDDTGIRLAVVRQPANSGAALLVRSRWS
jgi:hypothetical protein